MTSEAKPQSLWLGTHRPTAHPVLEGRVEADVVIVGAGITGLTLADRLKSAGKRVVVLEAQRIGEGTSGHTTGHLTTLWDGRYHELVRKHGSEAARAHARIMTASVAEIERIAGTLPVDCGFERLPGYYYTEDDEDELGRELDAARSVGLEVERVADVPLPFRALGAVRVADQAQFHPVAYLDGLARAVEGDGCRIFERSRAVEFVEGRPCEVRTPGGVVTAEKIVFATHLPPGVSPLQTEAAPYRSFVIAFTTRDGCAPLGLFWDTAEPYHYTRRARQDDEDLVVVGGEDRKTGHGSSIESFERLRQWTRERFDVDEIRWRWSAQLYEPTDRLPYVGKAPFAAHSYVATGFSGDGLTMGTAAAAILADLLLTGESPDGAVYQPSRTPLRSMGTFLRENVDVAKAFVADRVRAPSRDRVDGLARGEGCVVANGLSPIAVYRDADGSRHEMSAVCPHLDCVVRWNDAEKTFDCPCHGSRFATDGSVIEGPALRGLAR